MKCPTCSSEETAVDPISRKNYCKQCGTVIEKQWQHRAVLSFAFADVSKKEDRAVSELRCMDFGKAIEIGPSEKRRCMLRKWHKRTIVSPKYPSMLKTKEERAIDAARHELLTLNSVLKLPYYTQGQIIELYSQLYRKNFTFGRSRKAILAALIYIVSRRNSLSYYLASIAESTGVSKKLINKFSNLICKELGIKLAGADPSDYLIKIGQDLNLSPKTLTVANEILQRISEELVGRSPITLVAVSLHLSSVRQNEECSLDLVRQKVGVYPSTIKKLEKSINGNLSSKR